MPDECKHEVLRDCSHPLHDQYWLVCDACGTTFDYRQAYLLQAQRLDAKDSQIAALVEALQHITERLKEGRAAWDNREVIGQGISAEIRVKFPFVAIQKVAEAGGIADHILANLSAAAKAHDERVKAEARREGAVEAYRKASAALRCFGNEDHADFLEMCADEADELADAEARLREGGGE